MIPGTFLDWEVQTSGPPRCFSYLLFMLLLTGCATMQPATRDTWTGGEFDRLQSAHRSCIVEVNQAPGRPSAVVFLNPVEAAVLGAVSYAITPTRRALYKECMERGGYTKLQSEKVPSNERHWGAELPPFWTESACSQQPNQTCMIESSRCPASFVNHGGRCVLEEEVRAAAERYRASILQMRELQELQKRDRLRGPYPAP